MLNLDALEAEAVKAIEFTYGSNLTDEARFWIQKGIEGMRWAVADAQEQEKYARES